MRLVWMAAAALVVALASTVGAQAPVAPTSYQVIEVGTLPDDTGAFGRGINALGQTTGNTNRDSYIAEAFLWTNGSIVGLGSFGSTLITKSQGNAVNDNGYVVGYANNRKKASRAFLYNGSRLMDITGKDSSHGIAINNSNVVVGKINEQPFRWADGRVLMLPTLVRRGYGSANAINENGLIAGGCESSAGGRAVLWSSTGALLGALPLLTGTASDAFGLNDSGDVVGYATDASGVRHAVLWRNGAVIDLGPGSASDINNSGVVVGASGGRGYVYQDVDGDGVPEARNLNTLLDPVTGAGWSIRLATGINDSGQIVANGTKDGVSFRTCLLTPQ